MANDEEKRQTLRNELKKLYADISELYIVKEDFMNLGDSVNDSKYNSFLRLQDLLGKCLGDYTKIPETEWPEWVQNVKKAGLDREKRTCNEKIMFILQSFVTKHDLEY